MTRIKCKVFYDGSKFHGFQIQNKERSVQGEIQKAIKHVAQEDITIHASGRTDAKVHARGQVFHFDTSKDLEEERWKMAINHFLPNDIYIASCKIVDESFHARYSATRKEYRYYLNMGEYDPMQTNYIYQYNRPLDLEIMLKATKIFLGEHDFASYCVSENKGSTIRTIYEFTITQKENIIEFRLVGNGFRRYMVRHIVGALIQIGAHRCTIEKAKDRLDSCGKEHILYKAKPQGLYLYQVYYD